MAKVDDKTLRVNVIPALAKADDNPALSTPLTFTGLPEELDAELGKHLAGDVKTHQQTASTLAEAKATMEAAAKAAQEEGKRKADERKKATQKPPEQGNPCNGSCACLNALRRNANSWQRRAIFSTSGDTQVVPPYNARTRSN